MSNIKRILKRAVDKKERFDHIGWSGICRRCGLSHTYLGSDIYKEYEDARVDMREKELVCKSSKCLGRIKIVCKMSENRALHLCDIRRRS